MLSHQALLRIYLWGRGIIWEEARPSVATSSNQESDRSFPNPPAYHPVTPMKGDV